MEEICFHLGDLLPSSIPRCICLKPNPTRFEIHGFSDSSKVGYGGCIYLKCCNDHECSMHLLCSKSRVLPTKVQSIPRIELYGALLLMELMEMKCVLT